MRFPPRRDRVDNNSYETQGLESPTGRAICFEVQQKHYDREKQAEQDSQGSACSESSVVKEDCHHGGEEGQHAGCTAVVSDAQRNARPIPLHLHRNSAFGMLDPRESFSVQYQSLRVVYSLPICDGHCLQADEAFLSLGDILQLQAQDVSLISIRCC